MAPAPAAFNGETASFGGRPDVTDAMKSNIDYTINIIYSMR
jgi:hypothetical protein